MASEIAITVHGMLNFVFIFVADDAMHLVGITKYLFVPTREAEAVETVPKLNRHLAGNVRQPCRH